jgi:hypothetical protein
MMLEVMIGDVLFQNGSYEEALCMLCFGGSIYVSAVHKGLVGQQ